MQPNLNNIIPNKENRVTREETEKYTRHQDQRPETPFSLSNNLFQPKHIGQQTPKKQL